MKTLIIIPCYNEADNIENLLQELQGVYPTADYLVVNDASSDGSADILQRGGYRYISHPVNLGIGGGVQSGYLYAVQHGYDITVQMDGDGQHDPACLPAVVDPVAGGQADICIGSRFIENKGFQTSTMRRFGIRFLSGIIRLVCGARVRDVTSGFRACGREATAFYAEHYAQDYPEPEAIVAAVVNGFTVAEAPVVMRERQSGTSSISPIKSIYYMIKVSITLFIYRIIQGKKRRRPS